MPVITLITYDTPPTPRTHHARLKWLTQYALTARSPSLIKRGGWGVSSMKYVACNGYI